MTLEAALRDLYARVPRGMRLGLAAMNEACAAMGHPERKFEAIHVAGTNGKGSVCAMLEASARAAGKRTGMYTSPHLCRFAERIQIDGAPITDDALADLLSRVLVAAPELSFFETATLAAFVAFAEAKVDLAIVEVGIGGRLDATNVIPPPRAAAITRIAFDHMDRLGNTLVEIAREKAGIAKVGVPIVVGSVAPEVRAAIADVASAHGAHVVDGTLEEHAFDASQLPLAGAHQRGNALVAYHTAKAAHLDVAAIARGIETARWPGRMETVRAADGLYLLDGAHNPDGATALAAHLRTLAQSPLVLLFGALADKAWPAMLDILAPLTPHRVYVPPQGRAATPPEEIAQRHAGIVATTAPEALARARALAGPSGLVVICGSIYLVGEMRGLLLGLPRDPPVAL